jgi:hypothetical protein
VHIKGVGIVINVQLIFEIKITNGEFILKNQSPEFQQTYWAKKKAILKDIEI